MSGKLQQRTVPAAFVAYQVLNHGHIKVNGWRVNFPRCKLCPGDVIEVGEGSRELAFVLEAVPSTECHVFRSTPTSAMPNRIAASSHTPVYLYRLVGCVFA
jgi:ribosomal protein S4